eukprot:TRINITY_DN18625_c0_g1_i1.p1 TRINITY_DN18625_c0_g1~~TRINITY_DN18625_c0_g1_i1.p1  ORF type:complete len:255 (+),score=28.11 TRINITY_DN18625_c0_g1_i1:65-829(+)
MWKALIAAAAVLGGGCVVSKCTAACRRKRRIKLLIHGIQKRQNIGSMVRVAVAMGVEEIILVGKHERKDFGTFGAHGTQKHARFYHVSTLAGAKEYLNNDGFDLVGVEIMPNAKTIATYFPIPFFGGLLRQPWKEKICIAMGNEGQGMHSSVKAVCDWFTYIPQYSQGTASLNVTSAAAIVLHQYAQWGCSVEASREGEKFVVIAPPTAKEEFEATDDGRFDELRRARQAKVELSDEPEDMGWMDVEDDLGEGA